MLKGLKHGEGEKIYHKNEDFFYKKFKGKWKNGCFSKGSVYYVNGDTYEGSWKYNGKHGEGKMKY